jgi:hypothetical protein
MTLNSILASIIYSFVRELNYIKRCSSYFTYVEGVIPFLLEVDLL